MSGMASAAETMPGSVATLQSCSRLSSPRTAASSSSSANSRAGTRMFPRAAISHATSPTRLSSDIEQHVRAPATRRGLELEPVVGDGLDQVRRRAVAARHARPQRAVGELERRELAGHEALGLGEEDQLLQELGEQARAIVPAGAEVVAARRARLLVVEQLPERARGVREDAALAVGLEGELELAHVLAPAVTHPIRQLPVIASLTLPIIPPLPPPFVRVVSRPACTLAGASASCGSWPSRGAGSARLNSPLPSSEGPVSQRAAGSICSSAWPKKL